MRVEHDCPDVPFYLIPRFRWVPLDGRDRAMLDLDAFKHYEVASVCWLGAEFAGYFIRERKA